MHTQGNVQCHVDLAYISSCAFLSIGSVAAQNDCSNSVSKCPDSYAGKQYYRFLNNEALKVQNPRRIVSVFQFDCQA